MRARRWLSRNALDRIVTVVCNSTRPLAAVLLAILCPGMLSSCYAPQKSSSVPSVVLSAPQPTPVPERWILVRKSERLLTLFDGEQAVRRYPVVLGKDPYWAKLYQGDHRTPEGEYHIVKKYYHPFWSRFMLLDYPTERNQELYDWSQEHGVLPERGRSTPGIGGAIGIHGTENEELNRRGTNWTEGCVSLFNHDIDELYELVPVGTRVVIER